MGNSTAAYNQQKYTKTVQALLQEKLLAQEIANTSLIANMPNGNTLNFPRPTFHALAQYVKYTAVTDSDIVSTNETLSINETPTVSIVWDYVDEEDSAWDVIGTETQNIAFRLSKYVDAKVFTEIANAGYTMGSGGLGSTTPWQFTQTGGTADPVAAFGNAWAMLAQAGADTTRITTLMDPFTVNSTAVKAVSSRFTLGDDEFTRGKIRQSRGYSGSFLNTELFWSPNLTTIGSIALATVPTANDTVTVNGVVFKFVAALAAANDVLIEAGDATNTALNLLNAINQTSYNTTARAASALVAGTKYSASTSQTELSKLNGLYVTAATTTLTITSIFGQPLVSKSMTAAGNKFGQFKTYCSVMERGSIELVLRDNVKMEQEKVQGKFARRYQFLTRFGVKTFSQGAERMVLIPVETRAAE